MPVVCRELDVLYTDVPGTGGAYVSRVLSRHLGGEQVKPKHLSFRQMKISDPPSIRIFTMREPLDWYRWYWSRARMTVKHPDAWPIRLARDDEYPTRALDEHCGQAEFADFVRNVLRQFPEGFLRSLYCEYLNGTTHVLRYDFLSRDLRVLLALLGLDSGSISFDSNATPLVANKWSRAAILPRQLQWELREAENFDGLEIPYVCPPADGTLRMAWRLRRWRDCVGNHATVTRSDHARPL